MAGRNTTRVGSGAQLARGNRVLSKFVRSEGDDGIKGLSHDAIQQLRREAETSDAPNAINKVLAKMLEIYEKTTGKVIDPKFLRNPDTYFPHVLDPKWRRILAAADKKGGDVAAADFLRLTGTREEELLEEAAFYLDNTLEGSSFLEKGRSFGTDAEGKPQTFNIGGTDVTFSANDVDHINEQLHKAFPAYKGDFYDTDPKRVLEAYNTSLSRQAGRDLALAKFVKTNNPLVRTMTGDLDATRQAIDDALAQQGPAGMLSTAQGQLRSDEAPARCARTASCPRLGRRPGTAAGAGSGADQRPHRQHAGGSGCLRSRRRRAARPVDADRGHRPHGVLRPHQG